MYFLHAVLVICMQSCTCCSVSVHGGQKHGLEATPFEHGLLAHCRYTRTRTCARTHTHAHAQNKSNITQLPAREISSSSFVFALMCDKFVHVDKCLSCCDMCAHADIYEHACQQKHTCVDINTHINMMFYVDNRVYVDKRVHVGKCAFIRATRANAHLIHRRRSRTSSE